MTELQRRNGSSIRRRGCIDCEKRPVRETPKERIEEPKTQGILPQCCFKIVFLGPVPLMLLIALWVSLTDNIKVLGRAKLHSSRWRRDDGEMVRMPVTWSQACAQCTEGSLAGRPQPVLDVVVGAGHVRHESLGKLLGFVEVEVKLVARNADPRGVVGAAEGGETMLWWTSIVARGRRCISSIGEEVGRDEDMGGRAGSLKTQRTGWRIVECGATVHVK